MRPCHRHESGSLCYHCQDTGRCDCPDEAIEAEAQANAEFNHAVMTACVCGACDPNRGTCVATLLTVAADEAEDIPWQYR